MAKRMTIRMKKLKTLGKLEKEIAALGGTSNKNKNREKRLLAEAKGKRFNRIARTIRR